MGRTCNRVVFISTYVIFLIVEYYKIENFKTKFKNKKDI